jgi:hypothetical protein
MKLYESDDGHLCIAMESSKDKIALFNAIHSSKEAHMKFRTKPYFTDELYLQLMAEALK